MLPVNFLVIILKLIQSRVTLDMKMETPKISDLEKWHFKMNWCRKAGFSPYNDLYWELAERAYAHRYYDCSSVTDIPQIPLTNKIKEKDE